MHARQKVCPHSFSVSFDRNFRFCLHPDERCQSAGRVNLLVTVENGLLRMCFGSSSEHELGLNLESGENWQDETRKPGFVELTTKLALKPIVSGWIN